MPSDSFVFNPKAANDNPYIKEKRQRLSELREEVEDLKRRVLVNEQPLFESLLKFCFTNADPKDIRVLGRAIEKYGKLLPELTQLEEQVKAVDLVKAHPGLMELAFADSSDIAEGFEDLLKNSSE